MATPFRLVLTATLLLALSSVHGSILLPKRSSSLEDVKIAFEVAKIPSALGINFNPSYLLSINYTAVNVSITPGNTYPVKANTFWDPEYSLSRESASAASGSKYILFTLSLDAPLPNIPSFSPFRQSFLQGLTPDPHTGLLTTLDPELQPYAPPYPWGNPGDKTRFVILVYRQPPGFALQTVGSQMYNWDVKAFVEENHLGDAVSGSFFWIQNIKNP